MLNNSKTFGLLRADFLIPVLEELMVGESTKAFLFRDHHLAALVVQLVLNSPVAYSFTVQFLLLSKLGSAVYLGLLLFMHLKLKLSLAPLSLLINVGAQPLLIHHPRRLQIHILLQLYLILKHNLLYFDSFGTEFVDLSQGARFFHSEHAHAIFELLNVLFDIEANGTGFWVAQRFRFKVNDY